MVSCPFRSVCGNRVVFTTLRFHNQDTHYRLRLSVAFRRWNRVRYGEPVLQDALILMRGLDTRVSPRRLLPRKQASFKGPMGMEIIAVSILGFAAGCLAEFSFHLSDDKSSMVVPIGRALPPSFNPDQGRLYR